LKSISTQSYGTQVKNEIFQAIIEANYPQYENVFKKIEKISTSDEENAYLLGRLLRNLENNCLIHPAKSRLIWDLIQQSQFAEYFSLNKKPMLQDELKEVSILLFVSGIILLGYGVVQLYNGDFSIGVNKRYWLIAVGSSGYKIIIGLVLIISVTIRFRFYSTKHALYNL
jgi:hypothetical protein